MYHCVILLELNPDQVKELDLNSVRNITMQDFRDSLKRIRRSVSPASLAAYEKWSFEYGDVSLWFMMNCSELPNNRVRMKCNWRYGIANVLEYRRTVMPNVDTNSNTFRVFTPYYWTILIFIKEKKSSERVKGGKKILLSWTCENRSTCIAITKRSVQLFESLIFTLWVIFMSNVIWKIRFSLIIYYKLHLISGYRLCIIASLHNVEINLRLSTENL